MSQNKENVKLISISPNAEATMSYCARVSSQQQDNPDYAKLLGYCIKHGHWSVFEMAHMVLEITTSRAVAPQILRHRSFSFQEFSQRYAEASRPHWGAPRRQDLKNRQNSIDDLEADAVRRYQLYQREIWDQAHSAYRWALGKGIAKECARELLPLACETKLYMAGNIRSWIHYIQLRTDMSTQKEHRDIAEQCKAIFIKELPTVAKALEWG